MGCISSKHDADRINNDQPQSEPEKVPPSEHCLPQRSTGTKDHHQLAAASGPAIKAAWSPTPRLTDSASSGEALLQWARDQAASAGQPLQDFLNSNMNVRSDSSGSSSWVSSGMSEDGCCSSSAAGSTPLYSAAVSPYPAYDVYEQGCPVPACQEQRIETADAIQRMRATADGELESMLGALCTTFKVDTAVIVLMTGDCIAVCAACGVLAPGICPDRWGFCGWSFINTNHELLVIEDTHEDGRFADNFFVTSPEYKLRAYMAAPLVSSDGHRVGTLCILSQQPAKFTSMEAQLLSNMGELMVRQLERNWAMQLHARKQGCRLERALACYDTAYMLVDMSAPGWQVTYVNKPAQQQLGIDWKVDYGMLPVKRPAEDCNLNMQGVSFESFFNLQHANTRWAPHCCVFTVRDAQGATGTAMEGRTFTLTFRLATSDGLDAQQPFCIGVPAWLEAAGDGFGRSLFFMQVAAAAESSCGGASVASSRSSTMLSSWSAALSNSDAFQSFKLRGEGPGACPIDGLVLGPLLGKGSYGRVYRAVYKGMPVAVKIIENVANLNTTADGEPLEAVLTRGVHHLGIMRTVTYAYSAYKASCWMLFEYCDRTCVQDAVVKGWFRTDRRPLHGGVNLRTVALTAYEIASAMAFLHKHDIVHGDLKGGNVMLSSSSVNPHGFTAKVGDFGLARQATAGPNCPQNAYGTVSHMPPEVLLNGGVSKGTDVYSFGVLLWEMLTGSRAWAGLKHTQIICQVALMKRQLAMPKGMPPVMHSLLQRCLAPQLANRCTFEEVLGVLCDFLQRSRGDDLSSVQLTMAPPEGKEEAADVALALTCGTDTQSSITPSTSVQTTVHPSTSTTMTNGTSSTQ